MVGGLKKKMRIVIAKTSVLRVFYPGLGVVSFGKYALYTLRNSEPKNQGSVVHSYSSDKRIIVEINFPSSIFA